MIERDSEREKENERKDRFTDVFTRETCRVTHFVENTDKKERCIDE